MPELPDVEAFKRYFDSKALNQKIKKIEVKDKGILKTTTFKLSSSLENNIFKATERIGKNLLVKTNKNVWMIMHFGMTGHLEYFKEDEAIPKYSKVLFYFTNKNCLSFIDWRKFGGITIVKDIEDWKKEKQLGPDALDLNLKQFRKILEGKKSKIKSVLMDQKSIAGIGNIYADEILFQAEIHPETVIKKLKDEEIKKIHEKMKRVFDISIKHNAEPSELPSHFLLHHRKAGDSCPRCKGSVKKITLGGRSTYFCPLCQRG